jgi:hypothetical protein
MKMPNLRSLKARLSGATHPVLAARTLRLNRGEALTLHTALAGTLRVQQGRVWATFPCAQGGRDTDYFVSAGNDLRMEDASSVVLESWPLADGHGARLQWVPA